MKLTGYQKIVNEDMYDMVRRRSISWAELGLAIYLRGKAHRLGNPFYQSDNYTCIEMKTSKRILRKLRKSLQLKGLITFDASFGRNQATTYTMLDTMMMPRKRTQTGSMRTQTGPLCFRTLQDRGPKRVPQEYKNKEKKELAPLKNQKPVVIRDTLLETFNQFVSPK